jgi:pimeloyl-ACP methyl ester carboxylesterase
MRGEFVDVGGIRVYYYAAGTRGAGEPVVLLHGFPMSSRLWHAVVKDFPPGHRMVVCDLPGFGRSDPPAACEVRACSRSILGLLDDLRIERACIVGHGLGGGVAQALAIQAPTRVSRLALIDSIAFGDAPRRMARLARTLLPLARRAPPGFLAGLVQGSLSRGFADRDRSRLTLDTCLHPFTTPAGRDLLARHLVALRDDGTATLAADLASIRVPTAILWGGRDPFYPVSLGERLRDAIPGATLEVVPAASHFVPEDAPERVIAWLGELLARTG